MNSIIYGFYSDEELNENNIDSEVLDSKDYEVTKKIDFFQTQ